MGTTKIFHRLLDFLIRQLAVQDGHGLPFQAQHSRQVLVQKMQGFDALGKENQAVGRIGAGPAPLGQMRGCRRCCANHRGPESPASCICSGCSTSTSTSSSCGCERGFGCYCVCGCAGSLCRALQQRNQALQLAELRRVDGLHALLQFAQRSQVRMGSIPLFQPADTLAQCLQACRR